MCNGLAGYSTSQSHLKAKEDFVSRINGGVCLECTQKASRLVEERVALFLVLSVSGEFTTTIMSFRLPIDWFGTGYLSMTLGFNAGLVNMPDCHRCELGLEESAAHAIYHCQWVDGLYRSRTSRVHNVSPLGLGWNGWCFSRKNGDVDDADGGSLIYKIYSHQDLWKVSKCGYPGVPERGQLWIPILVPFLTLGGGFLLNSSLSKDSFFVCLVNMSNSCSQTNPGILFRYDPCQGPNLPILIFIPSWFCRSEEHNSGSKILSVGWTRLHNISFLVWMFVGFIVGFILCPFISCNIFQF